MLSHSKPRRGYLASMYCNCGAHGGITKRAYHLWIIKPTVFWVRALSLSSRCSCGLKDDHLAEVQPIDLNGVAARPVQSNFVWFHPPARKLSGVFASRNLQVGYARFPSSSPAQIIRTIKLAAP